MLSIISTVFIVGSVGITDWEIYRRMNMNVDYNNVPKFVCGFVDHYNNSAALVYSPKV